MDHLTRSSHVHCFGAVMTNVNPSAHVQWECVREPDGRTGRWIPLIEVNGIKTSNQIVYGTSPNNANCSNVTSSGCIRSGWHGWPVAYVRSAEVPVFLRIARPFRIFESVQKVIHIRLQVLRGPIRTFYNWKCHGFFNVSYGLRAKCCSVNRSRMHICRQVHMHSVLWAFCMHTDELTTIRTAQNDVFGTRKWDCPSH